MWAGLDTVTGCCSRQCSFQFLHTSSASPDSTRSDMLRDFRWRGLWVQLPALCPTPCRQKILFRVSGLHSSKCFVDNWILTDVSIFTDSAIRVRLWVANLVGRIIVCKLKIRVVPWLDNWILTVLLIESLVNRWRCGVVVAVHMTISKSSQSTVVKGLDMSRTSKTYLGVLGSNPSLQFCFPYSQNQVLLCFTGFFLFSVNSTSDLHGSSCAVVEADMRSKSRPWAYVLILMVAEFWWSVPAHPHQCPHIYLNLNVRMCNPTNHKFLNSIQKR